MRYLLIICMLISFEGCDQQSQGSSNPANEYFHMNYSYIADKNLIEVIADGNALIEDTDKFKHDGLINPDINTTYVNNYMIEVATFLAKSATEVALTDIYSHNDRIDSVKVETYLLWNNEYGVQEKHLDFSFNFNKNLYNKINWQSFRPENLNKIAPNFLYSNWYLNKAKFYA